MTITSPLLGPQSPEEQEVFAQEAEKFDREIADAITALRKQLAEAEARGVQVKPLAWTPRGDGAQWYAKCPNDRFHYTALPQFREELDGQWMTYLDDIWRPYPTLEAAKAAAQADYEARIRSCLIDAPSDEYTRGRIAGLKEAAEIADQWATDTQRTFGAGGPAAAIRALINTPEGWPCRRLRMPWG